MNNYCVGSRRLMPIRACKDATAKGFGGDRKAPEKERAACFDPILALSVSKYKAYITSVKLRLCSALRGGKPPFGALLGAFRSLPNPFGRGLCGRPRTPSPNSNLSYCKHKSKKAEKIKASTKRYLYCSIFIDLAVIQTAFAKQM